MVSPFLKRTVLVIILIPILGLHNISAQDKIKDKSFEYHVVSATPVNHLYPGKILGATNNEEENRIVSAQILKGELPEGITLFDDGSLAVKQINEHTSPDKYKIKAEFIDKHGQSFIKKIKFQLLKEADHTDVEASIRIAKPKFTNPKLTNHYQIGDVIAQFYDPDGEIKEAKLIKGSIPDGVMFVQNKKFVVTNPEALKGGEYFCLFFLVDQQGGNSVLAVSIPVGVQISTLYKEDYYSHSIKE